MQNIRSGKMYRQIEIVGMRKNRDVKIVITIIITAILAIIACVGIILYNKSKLASQVASANIVEEQMAGNSENVESTGNDEKSKTTAGEKESTEAQQSQQPDNKEFISAVENIYNGEEGKRAFLTFDDGPTEEVTPHILDILDKYNIKATFFVLGTRVKQNPDILKREFEAGHYIANHGYSHKYSAIYKSADAVLEEYNKTEKIIQEALGGTNYTSNLFRFPGGSHGGPYEKIKKEARQKLKENGVAYLDWSALTYDAGGADTKEEIINNLKKTLNGWDNVVILMHDAADKKITYETLEDVIKYLQEQGYAFKNIYDLK